MNIPQVFEGQEYLEGVSYRECNSWIKYAFKRGQDLIKVTIYKDGSPTYVESITLLTDEEMSKLYDGSANSIR
jgi:hypothetical protein